MRILFFADNFLPETNAPATHIYERCRLWVEGGHEVTVITCAPNFPEGRVYPGYRNRLRTVEQIDGIRVVRVKTFITANAGTTWRTLDYVSYAPSALLMSLAERKPDVVISSSPQLFVALAGVVYGTLRRVPHVFELRDLWPASILATTSLKPGRIYRMLERLELALYRRSKRVLSFTSSFVEDLTSRGVPAEKIDVVVNGASLDLFRPCPQKDSALVAEHDLSGKFVAGYLGTHGLAHGLENILETAELLRDEPFAFLLVGSGADKERLQSMAREKNLTNVIFVPRQSKEDLLRYWSLCDASLVHLRDDPLFATVIPSKIFESMAVGLPVIFVGPEGEGSSIVLEHGAGVVIPPAQPARLAEAVRALAADPQRTKEMAARSHEAAPLFSRERQAERTMEVLQRALNGAKKSTGGARWG